MFALECPTSGRPRSSNAGANKTPLCSLSRFVGMWFFVFCGIGGANSALRLNRPDNLPVDGSNPTLLVLNDTAVTLIAWCFGVGLMINIYAFYRFTGGVFNPAVAFSLFAIGAMTWTKFLMCWFRFC